MESALKSASSARTNATEAAATAKAAAVGYLGAFHARLAEATGTVWSTMDAKVVAPVAARVTGVLEAARGANAAGLACATSAREAAATAYWGIKEKGVKIWSAEAAQRARGEVGSRVSKLKTQAGETLTDARARMQAKAELASHAATKTAEHTKAKAKELTAATGELVSQRSFQATSASAAGGAAVLGIGGGAAGLAAGGAAGALAGLPLALFTLGLSVPLGAAMGGGVGLVVGTAAGAGAGAVGGGAAGYGAYAKRDDIHGAASLAASKAGDGAQYAKAAACQSAAYMRGLASATRARFIGAGTGGTESRD